MSIILSRWIVSSSKLPASFRPSAVSSIPQLQFVRRSFLTSTVRLARSNMEVELTAPNGKKWMQPLGLFINNEFVKSANEQKIASINPTFVAARSRRMQNMVYG